MVELGMTTDQWLN